MTKIKVLPALHGDAFIIEIYRGEESFIMVIDGGPEGVSATLRKEINALPHVDMMVLTHFDDDHILGMLNYIRDNEERVIKIKKFWFNLPQFVHIIPSGEKLSNKDAIPLFELMEGYEKKSGIELDWKERVVTKSYYEDSKGLVKITALAPTEDALKKNEALLEKKAKELLEDKGLALSTSSMKAESCEPEETQPSDSLESLVDKKFKNQQITNDASIVLLVEAWDGTRLLMGGDSTADSIIKGLSSLENSKGKYSTENPIEVDLFKVPHHGSKYNMSNDLLGMINTAEYLISTDGGKAPHKHPHRETLAKILLNPHRNKEKTLKLYLSHSLEEIRARAGKFISDKEIADPKYNFEVEDNKGSSPLVIIYHKEE